ADVEHETTSGARVEHCGHSFDRPPAGFGDISGLFVEANMDVLAAPDIEVEAVRVAAVVITLRRDARGEILITHQPSPSPSARTFSATWMRKSGSRSSKLSWKSP